MARAQTQGRAHTHARRTNTHTARTERLCAEIWDARNWFDSKATKELAERSTNAGRMARNIQGRMQLWFSAALEALVW